jgi:hypothetical protein
MLLSLFSQARHRWALALVARACALAIAKQDLAPRVLARDRDRGWKSLDPNFSKRFTVTFSG